MLKTTDLVPLRVDDSGYPKDESNNVDGDVEILDGEPVISLEVALRVLARIVEMFPEWSTLSLDTYAVVEDTSMQAYNAYCDYVQEALGIKGASLKDMNPAEVERFMAYTLHGLNDVPNFYSSPLVSPDVIREKYPEDSYFGKYLDFQLTITRVKVAKVFKGVYNRAFGLFNHSIDPERLRVFQCQFAEILKRMNITYENVRLVIFSIRDQEVESVRVIDSGILNDGNSPFSLIK